MSRTLGTAEKQPADNLDYDFDFTDWLADRNDTIASQVITADPGITVGTVTHLNGFVKVFLSGGTDGNSYKVTCTMTTTGGRVKQNEITIKVKEI
jgi:hypothetical protein